MRARKPIINFIILDPRWNEFISSCDIELDVIFDSIVKNLKKNFSKQEVSVVFMNDAEIQKLNKTYRKKDKPTNVLSFPSTEQDELGDILLSYETVLREANEAGISQLHHIYHLIVHGFLHLLGYDHENDEQALEMESMEILILKDLNMNNPYEDR